MAESIKKDNRKLMCPSILNRAKDKDCRSAPDSYHGKGIEEGLSILDKVREEFEVPVVSDFSDSSWAGATGEICDFVQVPAYLCRQTNQS